MRRIVLLLVSAISLSTWAQSSTALQTRSIQEFRLLIEKTPNDQRAQTLTQTFAQLVEKIKSLKSVEPKNPQLIELIELRILLSPIIELVKKSFPLTSADCSAAQHDVQFMESFGEQEGRKNKDGDEAVLLIKLFCSAEDL